MIAIFLFRSYKKWQKGESIFDEDFELISQCSEHSIEYDFNDIKSLENKTPKNENNEQQKESKRRMNWTRDLVENHIHNNNLRDISNISEFISYNINSEKTSALSLSYM